MDPTAAVSNIFDAVCEGDYQEATWHAEALQEWLAKGGFAPENPQDLVGALLVLLEPM